MVTHTSSKQGEFGAVSFGVVTCGAGLGTPSAIHANYHPAKSTMPPESLASLEDLLPDRPSEDVDQPSVRQGVRSGVLISGKLPNWAYAYIAIHCRDFGWVAFESPPLSQMFPGRTDTGDRVGVVVMSQRPDLTPGAIVLWNDETCHRAFTAEEDQAAASGIAPVKTYALPTGDRDNDVIYVEAERFLDPRCLATLSLPPVRPTSSSVDATADTRASTSDSQRAGLCITNARPVWLNAALAMMAVQRGDHRYVGLFNARTLDPHRDDPIGSIVVHSLDSQLPVGSLIVNQVPLRVGHSAAPLTASGTVAGIALGVIGLPDSGKSVLTRSLFSLTETLPNVFSIEANPDGQGRYFQQIAGEYYDRVRPVRWEFTDDLGEFYQHQVASLRSRLNLLWVGLGGRPSEQAQQTLQSCTHAILLSKDGLDGEGERLLDEWRTRCQNASTPILAEFRSDLHATDSMIDSPPNTTPIRGIAAGLQRCDPTVIQRCRPLAAAVLSAIMEPIRVSGIEAESVERFEQAAADLRSKNGMNE